MLLEIRAFCASTFCKLRDQSYLHELDYKHQQRNLSYSFFPHFLFVIPTYPKPHFHELLEHPAPHLSLWMESTWHLGIQTLLEKMDKY